MPRIQVWACYSCGEYERIYFPKWVYIDDDDPTNRSLWRTSPWTPWAGYEPQTGRCYCDTCGRMRRTRQIDMVIQ